MEADHIDAGALNERIEVLKLMKVGETYTWEVERRSWAKAELTARRNNFSAHGIGATGVKLTIRRQGLTLGNAIRLNGQHCFLTSIQPLGRNHLTVEAALVEVSLCEDKYTGTVFPAIPTEKYLRHEQEVPMAVNTMEYVLVTPKAIELLTGETVTVDGVKCPIHVAHTLDPNKNEFEIGRKVDINNARG